jgi:preprotein translocase subunit Sec61beta
MKMKTNKNQNSGPSSAIGIMRFKDTAKGIQISPELIVGVCVVIIVVILILRSMFNM